MNWQHVFDTLVTPEIILAVATLITSIAALTNAHAAKIKAEEAAAISVKNTSKLEVIHGVINGVAKAAQEKAVRKAVVKERVDAKGRAAVKKLENNGKSHAADGEAK